MAQQNAQLFQLLKKDHREAEQMMKQIQSASEDRREEVFMNLKEALQEHMQIEEKHFYPKIKNIAEMKELVQDALQEHQEAKQHLDELEEMDADSDDWLETFQEMQEGIQHHVQDEENEIFPRSAKVLSEDQLNDIAAKCQQEKGKSHPGAKTAAGKRKGATRKQPQL